jgi:hypothetical protein
LAAKSAKYVNRGTSMIMFLTALFGISNGLSEPKLNCEFRMRSWCINQGATKVEMLETSPGSRRWYLEASYLPGSAFAVVEAKGCSLGFANQIREVSRSEQSDEQGKRYMQLTYLIRKDGDCSLSFQIPISDPLTVDNAYTFMLTSIRLCADEACRGGALALSDPRKRVRRK